jgi:hypothetical protein
MTRLLSPRAALPALAASALLAAGCGLVGSGSKQAELNGKVVYNDAPVTGGQLRFYPADGSAPVPGSINADGTFSFGGLPTGTVKVTVDTEPVKAQAAGPYRGMKPPEGAAPPPSAGGAGGTPVYVKVPRKYADPKTTDLTVELKSGTQTKNLVLKD